MRKAFSQIDLFGKAVLFNYKGNSKSKSKVGAILTLALLGFVIWLLYYFGQSISQKKEPKANTYESFDENPPATVLNSETFPVGFGLSDPATYASYINESIYTLMVTTYRTTRVPQGDGTVNIEYDEIPLDIERCTPNHFGDLGEKFSYLALDQMYCLKKEQPNLNGNEITLQGTFESPIYHDVTIIFLKCDNTTSTVPCGTPDEIDSQLEGGYFSLSYPNLAVDLTDNKQPIQKFRDGFYTTVGSTSSKDVTLELQQLEINTDSGWLTSEYDTKNYIKFDNIRELFTLKSKGYIMNFAIRLATMKKHYSRSYTKVQDVVAQVNGIATVAFTVLFLVLAPYARLKFYEALINEIFDVKLTKGKSKSKKNRKKQAQRKKAGQDKSEQKNKPLATKTEIIITSHKDLEQQRLAFGQTDLGLSDIIESPYRKPGNEDIFHKKVQSIEEFSVKGIPFDQLESPNESRDKSNAGFQGPKTQGLKEQAGLSLFKAKPPILSIESQFEDNKPEAGVDLEPASSMMSPQSLKGNSILSIRKPKFTQPTFKVLDYDTHGPDLFEDMLKNAVESQILDKKADEDKISNQQIEGKEHQKIEARPAKIVMSNNGEEEETDKEERKKKIQRSQSLLTRHTEEINLSFWEYLRSFFSKSEAIKEKMYILKEGIKRIDERLDIFNLFKKLREFDKLRVLLLENEQFVLFDSLPRPELTVTSKDLATRSSLLSTDKMKDAQFIQDKIKIDLIMLSYENLKRKPSPTMLDKKLFDIYDSILGPHS